MARRLPPLPAALLLVVLVLAACGPAPEPTATRPPTHSVLGVTALTPTAPPTPTAMPSPTAIPPTATPRPAPPSPTSTRTPSPSPTPPLTATPRPAPPSPTSTRTPSPSPTPPPTATHPPTPLPPAVAVRRDTLVVPAYPFQDYLVMTTSAEYGISYPRLNWSAFVAAPQQLVLRSLAAIVLENEYLRLTIVPELGGRIYQAVFKPTGHHIFYRNPVLKPTRWGHESQGWWLAAGGVEWCLPVEEHGYEWGVPWEYSIAQGASQASVTVWDSEANDRIRARITITLEAGRSYFSISPRIENPTARPLRYQFWLNAMLASGGTNSVSQATEFILPADQVTVHSTGDRTLPQAGQVMSWPVYSGRAMNLYSSWREHLGVFARPHAQSGFMGAYDHASGEGLLRTFPSDIALGTKLFAGKGLDPSLWTDDGSTYFELHGGVTPTFWDYATLAPGGSVGWSERWYPYLGIGAVQEANEQAALSLAAVQGGYRLGVAATRPLQGRLVLTADGRDVWSQAVALTPVQPFVQTVSTSATNVTLRLEDEQGRIVIQK